MIFGSVCSGIEAASCAWHPLGWRASFVSEIEAFPRAVLQHRWKDTPLHGDFTTIQAGQYDPIDLLVGGTPCQSFSVAGLRGGLDDERGNLALEYLRLADRLRPRWLVWENVPGVLSSAGGRDFGSILGGLGELGYGFAYRVLDAQFFGVAQRRRRVFVVGHLGDWRRAAAVLFERHGLQGNPSPRRQTGEGAARCLTRGSGGGQRYDGDSETFIPIAGTFQNTGHGWWNESDCAQTLRTPDGGGSLEANVVAHALRGEGFDASEDGTGRGTPLVPISFPWQVGGTMGMGHDVNLCGTLVKNQTQASTVGSAVRRLTPRECERLQGFADDYTLIPYRSGMASDGPRYKALGNSMAVPVMAWIGRRIEAVEALSVSARAA
jgi:DNA (cytosine-5)-methyltransferase 1